MARTDTPTPADPQEPVGDDTSSTGATALDADPTVPPELAVTGYLMDEDDDDLEDLDDLDDLRPQPPTSGHSLAARAGLEMFGTFVVVLIITGTALYNPLFQITGGLGVALAGGLALAGVTAAFGLVSGGHFNPAVTLAAAVAGRLAWLDLALYWVAQVTGAVAGAAVVFVTVPSALPGAIGSANVIEFMSGATNGIEDRSPLFRASQGAISLDVRSALIIELVGAAVLAAVYLGAGHRWGVQRTAAPVAIGLTYAALLLFTAPFTGSSVNPARSTGPAVLAGVEALKQLWLFWVGPLVGAAIAGLVYRAARGSDAVTLAVQEPGTHERY